jgi:hypothetical protein
MVIDPLPLTADAQTWQAAAHEQQAQLAQFSITYNSG